MPLRESTVNQTKDRVRQALEIFIDKDKEELLKANAYEVTICHRIAVYLEKGFFNCEFEDNILVVDCEFNRHLLGPKMNAKGDCFRPDIIIHKRNDDSKNFIMIEVKKHGLESNPAQNDIKKLIECMKEPYCYKLGIFIGILKRKIDICWIEKKNGKITETFEELENNDN